MPNATDSNDHFEHFLGITVKNKNVSRKIKLLVDREWEEKKAHQLIFHIYDCQQP